MSVLDHDTVMERGHIPAHEIRAVLMFTLEMLEMWHRKAERQCILLSLWHLPLCYINILIRGTRYNISNNLLKMWIHHYRSYDKVSCPVVTYELPLIQLPTS